MAVATLSTLAANYFRGGRRLFTNKTDGLKALLNIYIAKINEVIAEVYTPETLTVGNAAGYYLAGRGWLVCDGTNPPTVAALRVQTTDTGVFFDCTITAASAAANTWVMTAV